MRPYFETVMIQARIHTARPDPRLADTARATERRCAVRNLLADAGVRMELRWSAVSPETPSPRPSSPEVREAPGVARQPDR